MQNKDRVASLLVEYFKLAENDRSTCGFLYQASILAVLEKIEKNLSLIEFRLNDIDTFNHVSTKYKYYDEVSDARYEQIQSDNSN